MHFLRATAPVALVVVVVAGIFPAVASAQGSVRVRTTENVRKEPNGEILGQLEPGTTLSVAGHRKPWVQVDVDGWVWARSLQVSPREGLDLIVSADEGENLRDAPSGNVLGRLARGMLLEEVERRTGWIRVRRRAWMWGPSLVEVSPVGAPAKLAGARAAGPTPKTGAGVKPRSAVARKPVGYATAGPGGASILSAPGADTLALASPRAEMEVVAREGSWARVRLEGWTWLPEGDTTLASAEDGGTPLTPADLRRDPAAYRGRLVSWELQFISLEHAEKVRTDFFEGEPFLLARYGGSEGPFVYVAVPPARAQDFEKLIPLERISVTGRVRSGASSLTGTPIVDLVSLKRVRAP